MYDAHKLVGSNPSFMGWMGFLDDRRRHLCVGIRDLDQDQVAFSFFDPSGLKERSRLLQAFSFFSLDSFTIIFF